MTRYLRKTSTTEDRGQNQRSKESNLEKIETVEREEHLKLLVSSEKSEKDYPCENFFKRCYYYIYGLPWWIRGKNLCLQCRRPGFNPWVGKIPWRRKWQHTPVFLPGESHGLRSQVGYSLQGCKESDTTEQLHFHFHYYIQGKFRVKRALENYKIAEMKKKINRRNGR